MSVVAAVKSQIRLVSAARLKQFTRCSNGATAIEYALILSLIFLAIVGAVRGFTDSTSTMYSEIASTLEE